MALDIATIVNDSEVEITLSGELDAATAPLFQKALEGVLGGKPQRLVLRVGDLVFLASAGVRMLIFARQKMAPGLDVYVISPQEMVRDTIQRTGLQHSVIIQDEYPAAV